MLPERCDLQGEERHRRQQMRWFQCGKAFEFVLLISERLWALLSGKNGAGDHGLVSIGAFDEPLGEFSKECVGIIVALLCFQLLGTGEDGLASCGEIDHWLLFLESILGQMGAIAAPCVTVSTVAEILSLGVAEVAESTDELPGGFR